MEDILPVAEFGWWIAVTFWFVRLDSTPERYTLTGTAFMALLLVFSAAPFGRTPQHSAQAEGYSVPASSIHSINILSSLEAAPRDASSISPRRAVDDTPSAGFFLQEQALQMTRTFSVAHNAACLSVSRF